MLKFPRPRPWSRGQYGMSLALASSPWRWRGPPRHREKSEQTPSLPPVWVCIAMNPWYWSLAVTDPAYQTLVPLLEKIFVSRRPQQSAPVKCIFSHGVRILRPYCARLGDKMLSDLVYLKCNKPIRDNEWQRHSFMCYSVFTDCNMIELHVQLLKGLGVGIDKCQLF